ncbi:hypothetical protein D2E76_27300 [Mycobacteroides abscessus]|uniref:Helix-turn-helix domain-containing protein n=1 Tax=Mycobacteroides abscessus TaxID=36809 RepID=A0ABD7HGT8_9MYCO|nr:hypothetical protein [Mycobacteroides abscessus]RIT28647.1 hypothetical protein D2E76_27300 [Mycobacteroides abscessus]
MTFSKFEWNRLPERVRLKNTTAAVASEMFNRASMDGTGVLINQKKMARTLETSERTVGRALTALVSEGLIWRTKKGSNAGRNGGASVYVLTMPKNTGHPSPEHRTSVTGTPDTSDRLIDPLIDPGNRPGSYLSTTAGEDIKSEPALRAVSAEGQGSDLGSLYDTPTESDLPSVAHIAVPTGTALVHQPTTETNHPSGLSEDDRASILADLYGSAAEPSQRASDPEAIHGADTAILALLTVVPVDEPGWDGSGTPWPRDKAIPADPWGTPYFDEHTGEHFEYRPGELPVVAS